MNTILITLLFLLVACGNDYKGYQKNAAPAFNMAKCLENVMNEARAENYYVSDKQAVGYCKILEKNPNYHGDIKDLNY